MIVCIPRASADNTVGPTNQVICNKQAILNAAAAGTTQLVSGVAGQSIYICGWHVTTASTAGTFQLISGTGGTCGTATATYTPAISVSSTAPSADHITAAWANAASGAGFCITTATSATITALVFYSQF